MDLFEKLGDAQAYGERAADRHPGCVESEYAAKELLRFAEGLLRGRKYVAGQRGPAYRGARFCGRGKRKDGAGP